MTPLEQAVALVIADICMDTTRRPPRNMNAGARVCEDLGITPGTLGNILAKLSVRGLELRVPVTDRNGKPVTDKRGRLLFATKRHAVDYLFPELTSRDSKGPSNDGPLELETGSKAPLADGPLEADGPLADGPLSIEGPWADGPLGLKGPLLDGPLHPRTLTPNSKEDARSLSAAQRGRELLAVIDPGVTERDAELVLKELDARPAVGSAIQVLPREIADGNGPGLLARARAAPADSTPTPAPTRYADQCKRCFHPGHRAENCPDRAEPTARLVAAVAPGEKCRYERCLDPGPVPDGEQYHERCSHFVKVNAGRDRQEAARRTALMERVTVQASDAGPHRPQAARTDA
jgi:hypothetical protein